MKYPSVIHKNSILLGALLGWVCWFAGSNVMASDPMSEIAEIRAEAETTSLSRFEAADYQYPIWGYYVLLSPGLTNILNNDLAPGWTSDNTAGINAEFGYFKAINAKLKYKAGFGIHTVGNKLSIGDYTADFMSRDIDNDSYQEYLYLDNLQESVNFLYLSLPVRLEFGTINVDKPGFYINGGLRLSYLLNANTSGSGNYTAEGYYEQYNVLLHDIPELGFYNNQSVSKDKNGYNNFNVSLVGAAGISIPLSRSMILKFGVNADYGLSNLSSTPDAGDAFESNMRNQYVGSANSIFADPSARAISRIFGFEMGIYLNRLLY